MEQKLLEVCIQGCALALSMQMLILSRLWKSYCPMVTFENFNEVVGLVKKLKHVLDMRSFITQELEEEELDCLYDLLNTARGELVNPRYNRDVDFGPEEREKLLTILSDSTLEIPNKDLNVAANLLVRYWGWKLLVAHQEPLLVVQACGEIEGYLMLLSDMIIGQRIGLSLDITPTQATMLKRAACSPDICRPTAEPRVIEIQLVIDTTLLDRALDELTK